MDMQAPAESDSDLTGDDSEMLSSASESSSLASTVSSPDDSLPGSPMVSAPPPRVPTLRFSLGSPSAVESPRNGSSRGKPTASPSPLAPRSEDVPGRGGPVTVELLSPAFPLTQMSSSEPGRLHAQCATNLGVGLERVRLFALVEVTSGQKLPAHCKRVAVEVAGSSASHSHAVHCCSHAHNDERLLLCSAGFSLRELEKVLEENQSLAATAAVVATTSGAGDPEDLQDMLGTVQRENARLRRQLDASEGLRQQGQQLLRELKTEFAELHDILARHASSTTVRQHAGGLPDTGTPTVTQEGRPP